MPTIKPIIYKINNINDAASQALTEMYTSYLATLRLENKISEEEEKKRLEEMMSRSILYFQSEEDATVFFNKLAKEGYPFLAIEIDKENNLTGSYYFSDGDKMAYHGKIGIETMRALQASLCELDKNLVIRNQVDDALKKSDDSGIKEALSQLKTTTQKPTIHAIHAIKQDLTDIRTKEKSTKNSPPLKP